MATEGQGSLVLNEISTDGTNWKVIVCEDNSQISGTSSTNETKTKNCGTFTGVSTNPVVVTGSGVAGADLAANQASYMDLQILRDAKTKIYFRRQNALAGTVAAAEITYAIFRGYVTEATETSSADDVIKFNWAVTSTGTVDFNSVS